MDEALSDSEREMIAKAGEFARTVVAPNANEWEASRRIPKEVFAKAAAQGFSAIQVPKSHGGLDLGYRAKMRITEELAKACMAFSFAMINTHNTAAKIARDLAPEVAAKYLPGLLACEIFGATALSEPHAGSDFSNIKTSAVKDAGGWRLNGEKTWITNAAIADVFIAYAQTDATKGWRGIACFLVDAHLPGFSRSPQIDLVGGNAIGTGGFTLEDYFLPDSHLIYPAGEAFKMAMGSINGARTYVAAMCCGMVDGALHQAVDYGRARTAFGKPLTANQGLRWLLADIATDLEAARLLTYRAAELVEAGAPEAVLAAAHAKKFAARMAQARLPDCIQAMGANGLRTDNGLGRQLACAKIAHYVDGSTEIQNDRIAAILLD
jgi:alkylation response protein AidB-like acyl-CoA dehydrogenase